MSNFYDLRLGFSRDVLVTAMSKFYVHFVSGNDFTGDGSFAYPFKTLQRAVSESGVGDVIYVLDNSKTSLFKFTPAEAKRAEEMTTAVNPRLLDKKIRDW